MFDESNAVGADIDRRTSLIGKLPTQYKQSKVMIFDKLWKG